MCSDNIVLIITEYKGRIGSVEVIIGHTLLHLMITFTPFVLFSMSEKMFLGYYNKQGMMGNIQECLMGCTKESVPFYPV